MTKKYFKILFPMLTILLGCGNAQIDKDSISIPLPLKAASLGYYDAYATLDESADRYDLYVDTYDNVIEGNIYDIPSGDHVVHIYVSARANFEEDWLEIANVSLPVSVSDETTTTIVFTEDKYEYPDDDGDGYSNLDEMAAGTDPKTPMTLGNFAYASFKKDTWTMGNVDSEYYSDQCGNNFNPLPNPFRTDLVTVYITEAYEADDYPVATDASQWRIVDATGSLIIEYDYVEFTGGAAPVHFIMADGIECTGSLTNKYSNDDITLTCAKDEDICELVYEEF